MSETSSEPELPTPGRRGWRHWLRWVVVLWVGAMLISAGANTPAAAAEQPPFVPMRELKMNEKLNGTIITTRGYMAGNASYPYLAPTHPHKVSEPGNAVVGYWEMPLIYVHKHLPKFNQGDYVEITGKYELRKYSVYINGDETEMKGPCITKLVRFKRLKPLK